jgi:hypothetical protein
MYKNKTDQELISILDDFESLSFESKLNLKEEIEIREINIDQAIYGSFINSIELKYKEIEQLEFLKHLGFEVVLNSSDKLTILRSQRATIINTIASVAGFFALIIGIDFIVSGLLLAREGDMTIAMLATLAGVGLSVLSILLFYKNVNWLITYNGFNLSLEAGKCMLTKRVDLVKTSFIKDISSLRLQEKDKESLLLLDDVEVFGVANPNVLNSLTLQALLKTSKNYC